MSEEEKMFYKVFWILGGCGVIVAVMLAVIVYSK